MASRIEHAIDILERAKKDKRTLVIAAGCVISFGVAIGSMALYERLIKEISVDDELSYFKKNLRR